MKTAWIFCDQGKIGSLKQAEALAWKLGFEYEIFNINLMFPWKYLPPQAGLFNFNPLSLSNKKIPNLIIGIGRQSVIPTLYYRQHTKTIFLQNPKINPAYFTYVIAPKHDHLKGTNVIETMGSLHKISPSYIESLPKPIFQSHKKIAAIFIGGSSKHVKYTQELIHKICDQIEKTENIDLLITPSRRTDPSHIQILKNRLGSKAIYFYDFSKSNPYLDYIKAADMFFVTTDSISMMSELCSSGKPTYLLDVGVQKEKFKEFVQNLVNNKAACLDYRPFHPSYILNDLENVYLKLKL